MSEAKILREKVRDGQGQSSMELARAFKLRRDLGGFANGLRGVNETIEVLGGEDVQISYALVETDLGPLICYFDASRTVRGLLIPSI